MENVKIPETVHYLKTVDGYYEDGQMVLTSVREIPCGINANEDIQTGSTFETVNCPDCIERLTRD